MFRNIDILAIASLLMVLALVSQIRQSAVLQAQSAHLMEITHRGIQPLLTNIPMPQSLCLTRE